jgi:hypothetical protein
MAYETAQSDGKPADDLDSNEILAEFKCRVNESKQHSQDWRQEAKTLYDTKAGHQWSPQDIAALEEKCQGAYPTTVFNVSNKYCNSVTGLQINNRQEIRYYPREQGDVGIDEFTTGAVKWCRDESEAEDEETDSFEDLFWVGMGWVEHFLSEDDPEAPYIGQERRDPLEMLWDPLARKRNLVDREYQIRVKPFSPAQYEEFFGESATVLEGNEQIVLEESSPQRISIPHDYGDGTPGTSKPSRIYVADYQFCRRKSSWKVTAQFEQGPVSQIFSDKEWRDTKKQLDLVGIQFEAERIQTKVYYRAWICGDQIRKKIMELPCGFTYEAITGQRDRNANTWFGMGRVVQDPQKWMNKFFASILYTISVNAKGGLLAEEDAFEDQAKAERSWANPAAITFAASGAVSGGKIQPKPQAQYPQGMDRLMQFSLELLPLTSGMNPELMGLAGRDQPGVLEAQRKQAAMSIIAWVFDAMRRYYKRSGKLMLSMIREYLNEGQLIRISGEQGQKYIPLIKDRLVSKYDVIVDESPTSVNMIERTWAILQNMIPMALQAQIPVPPEVIDYAPIPEDLKTKWKQKLQPTPEQQQMQQKQAQLTEQGAQAKIMKDQTSAQLNAAKAEQVQAETATNVDAAPIHRALTEMQTLKTAADAGAAQAGGN